VAVGGLRASRTRLCREAGAFCSISARVLAVSYR
jgi:hypothetical protein